VCMNISPWGQKWKSHDCIIALWFLTILQRLAETCRESQNFRFIEWNWTYFQSGRVLVSQIAIGFCYRVCKFGTKKGKKKTYKFELANLLVQDIDILSHGDKLVLICI
jgi:hypothetical protein